MTKHTPGPWKAEDRTKYATEDAPFTYAIMRGDGSEILAMICDNGNHCDADADLISAAPDLLRALEGALAYNPDQYERIWYKDALVAMAKAKGERS